MDEREQQEEPFNPSLQTTSRNGENCNKVDMYMLPAKLAYFFKMCIYDKMMFAMLFYLFVGLSPLQAGIVNGFQHLGGLMCAPLIGLIADKTQKYTMLATVCCVMTVAANGMQPLISWLYINNNNVLFYALLITSVIASVFETGAFTFVDSGLLQRIRNSKKPVNYGFQRLFGSIGAIIASLFDSLAVRFFPRCSLSPYTGVFIVYATFGLCLLITLYFLFNGCGSTEERDNVDPEGGEKENENEEEKEEDEKPEEESAEVHMFLIEALTSLDNIVFFIGVLLNGAMQAMTITFGFVYLKEFNAPTMLFALGNFVAASSAIGVYFRGHWLIRVFKSPENSMCVSWIFMGLRMITIAYFYSLNPYMFLIPEALQGLTYALFWASLVEFINITSHPSILTTMCGILNSLYNPCSYLLANLLGAKLYADHGGFKTFFGSGIFCFLWALLYFGYIFLRRKRLYHYKTIRN